MTLQNLTEFSFFFIGKIEIIGIPVGQSVQSQREPEWRMCQFLRDSRAQVKRNFLEGVFKRLDLTAQVCCGQSYGHPFVLHGV